MIASAQGMEWYHWVLGPAGLAAWALFYRWWAGPKWMRKATRPWLSRHGQAHPGRWRDEVPDDPGGPYDE